MYIYKILSKLITQYTPGKQYRKYHQFAPWQVLLTTNLYLYYDMDDYNRTVYVDMDGVLADFDKGFFDITGRTSDNVQDQELWAAIDAHGKAKFFGELQWMPGGKELWAFATDNFLKVKILSALGKSDKIDKQTTQGKLVWLRHNIPALQLDDIILVQNKHSKKHYCKPDDIIIDDTLVVIEEWNSKGGIGILHKTAGETIAKLRQYV